MMPSGLQPSAGSSLVTIRQLVARYPAFTEKGLRACIARARSAERRGKATEGQCQLLKAQVRPAFATRRLLIDERQFLFAVGLVSPESPTAVAEPVAAQIGTADRQRMTAAPASNRQGAMKKQRVRVLEEQSAIVLDNESKERALVGYVISTVALAGQISREKNVSDHGIDMEIEFKDDRHEPMGEMLFLQLKSGDSYLRERKRDGAEIFTIKDERHARYWMAQKFPVLLVIRSSGGEVRWMEISSYLRRESDNGKKPVKQIVFEGERLDVMSVRRWREKALGQGLA